MQTKEERDLGKNKAKNSLASTEIDSIKTKVITPKIEKDTTKIKVLANQTRIFASRIAEITKTLSLINTNGVNDDSKKIAKSLENLAKKIQKAPKNVPERIIKKAINDLEETLSLKENVVTRKHEIMYAQKFPKMDEMENDRKILVGARKMQENFLSDIDVFEEHFLNDLQKK